MVFFFELSCRSIEPLLFLQTFLVKRLGRAFLSKPHTVFQIWISVSSGSFLLFRCRRADGGSVFLNVFLGISPGHWVHFGTRSRCWHPALREVPGNQKRIVGYYFCPPTSAAGPANRTHSVSSQKTLKQCLLLSHTVCLGIILRISCNIWSAEKTAGRKSKCVPLFLLEPS